MRVVVVSQAHRSQMAADLLAAAEKLGLPANVVVSRSEGFAAPPEVLKEAGVLEEEKGPEPEKDAPKPDATKKGRR